MTKSEACALHDGIGILKDERGYQTYLIPCCKCGKIIKRKQYTSEKDYLCDYCTLNLRERKKAKAQAELDKVRSRKEQAFDKAVERIRKQVRNFDSYRKAVRIAETRAERYGSIPEAMVAIELLKLGYNIIPQQKIGRYKVDFAIPDQKLVIEVDGELYHGCEGEGKREATIQISLGFAWKIIHVPAEWIEKDIRTLKKVIEASTCNTRGKNL